MSKSRYSETPIIDRNHYGTTSLPVIARGYREINLLEGIRTIEHVFQRGERFDHLAAKYLGDDQYGWIICLVNKIDYPLGITPGTTLRIPLDVNDIFSKIFK